MPLKIPPPRASDTVKIINKKPLTLGFSFPKRVESDSGSDFGLTSESLSDVDLAPQSLPLEPNLLKQILEDGQRAALEKLNKVRRTAIIRKATQRKNDAKILFKEPNISEKSIKGWVLKTKFSD